MTNVFMTPSPVTVGKGVSGIHTVIRAYGKMLPKFGVNFVEREEDADIKVSHAGMGHGPCDVAMLHGIYFTDDYNADTYEWRANYHVIRSVAHSLLVTVPSAWVAETLQRDFRIDPVVVPHGIFPEEWTHKTEYEPKTVLWAKNRYYDVCDPAPLNKIAKRMRDFRFFTTIAAPGAPKNVVEIGVQETEEMKRWIQKCSMVISTVKETWGILYAEALASGTPVVTSNQGHVKNLVKHGTTGYVYRHGNLDDIEYGLRWTEASRPALSANASKLAAGLSWQRVGQYIADVFKLAARMKRDGYEI